ncbi:MAG TPA: helix-turn-helix domain-containing protein [Stellaceae bacterium]|nr:helix-turn-helix domain-containing protein [Stellaceae bacterium]
MALSLRSERGVPQFNFILQPEFPLNALILASEALRIANQNSGRHFFSWCFVSETGEAVRASNGMWFGVDCAIEQMPPGTAYLIFASNLPTQRNSPKLLGHLRLAARFGAIVGSIDTGAFALAQAGLIGREREPNVVLHWEAEPTFRERFPAAQPLNQLYLLGDTVAQCSGGVATLDMMLDLIGRFAGEALANEVANALVHTRRPPAVKQRNDAPIEARQNSISSRLIALMEKNLDFPLSLPELAKKLKVPARTLSYVCKQVFGESPMRLYLRIRLQAARNFLFYEEFSIKAVSNACGFSYPAVFSRVFKAQFAQTPREFRARLRKDQNMAMRPEIRRLISRQP